MLQSTYLSKVYGHGHIKKFWLMQNQKETENKALLTSSSSPPPPPSKFTGSSSGLGHERKQGSPFSVGCSNTRKLTSPSGLLVRPLVSSPACFSMAMARQTSLVTCAESFNRPLRMGQSRSVVRLPPSSLASTLKEESCCLAADGDCISMKSPCKEDVNSVSLPQWGSSLEFRDQFTVDFSSSLTSKEEGLNNVHDGSPPRREPGQDSICIQEELWRVKKSDGFSGEKHSSGPPNCSLGFFSDLEIITPFSVPFQLPDKYFLEEEAKSCNGEAVTSNVGTHIISPGTTDSGKDAIPLILNREHGRMEVLGTIQGREDVGSTVLRICTVCGTSKTPLWRSGPQGPKSLCNACGIRLKKARKGSSGGTDYPSTPLASPSAKALLKPMKRKQEDEPSVSIDTDIRKSPITKDVATQVVKRRRWSHLIQNGECEAQNCEANGSSTESCVSWNLHSSSSISTSHFERLSIEENLVSDSMDPGKDEREAAMLLIYLSCSPVFTQHN